MGKVSIGPYWDMRGKSADKDSLDIKGSIPNGSTYFETDTGKLYIWDEDEQEWKEM